ncbi:SRPBCC family protein [Brumimicrobium mesophilum]|uniref:SRPBCC family protein n=1 Tax=Brumimicrobium mesophilum TaxID=392717 RepID=UPI00293739B4|nr:SRPBCC family protein [Brumimicrobium mesophilum]
MKVLKKILIVLAVIVAIPLIVALFVKKEYTVKESIVIDKSKSSVFDYIKNLKNQDNYSKWATMDPNMVKTYSGTDATVGFVSAWESDHESVGAGEQEIINIVEGERIDYELRFFRPFESTQDTYMSTETVEENKTRVTWGFSGKMNYPMNLTLLFMDFEELIGDDFQVGLNKLKTIIEKEEDMKVEDMKDDNMKLGAFSISLAVNDIHKSKAFYEKLGFSYKGGNIDQNWVVLKNGDAVIGLFQGMFEENIITFNPGWDSDAQNIEEFDDVRVIQEHLESLGINLTSKADLKSSGPAHITLTDPDGNSILIDQHR